MLMNMIGRLPKVNDKVFGIMTTNSAIQGLINARKQVSYKLGNPRIAKIHYHLIRIGSELWNTIRSRTQITFAACLVTKGCQH